MKNAPENYQNVGARYLGRALQILFLLLCHVKQNFECDNSKLINYTKVTSVDFANSRDIQGGKKGPGGPGTFKKSPGTFRVSRSCPARTTGPSRSLGPVLPGPRDFQGL